MLSITSYVRSQHWHTFVYKNIVAAFRGMNVSSAKHSYVWLPREKVWLPDRCTDTQRDRRQTKWSLCAAMLRRQHNKGSYSIKFCFHTLIVHARTRWVCETLVPLPIEEVHTRQKFECPMLQPNPIPASYDINTILSTLRWTYKALQISSTNRQTYYRMLDATWLSNTWTKENSM